MTQVGQDTAGVVAQPRGSGPRTWLPSRLAVAEPRLLREGLWITGGHMVAAAAALIGVRLTTEVAPAAVYGAFVLFNGVLALLQGVLLQPVAQAALRYYPEYASIGRQAILRKQLTAMLARRCCWGLGGAALGCGIDAVTFQFLSPVVWLLLAGALGLEAWKATEVVLRNAARRQTAYSALYAADGIGRATGVVAAAWTLVPSLESLLLGQCIAVLVVLALFTVLPAREEEVVGKGDPTNAETASMTKTMSSFAAPLLWGPIIGWVSGLADRYVVGGVLGLGQAAIYAAAGGLVSRPMLMIGAVSDATLRQVLYSAASRQDRTRVHTTLTIWLTVNFVAGALLTLLLMMFSRPIVNFLLAPDYRADAAILLPWLTAGYVLVLLDQVVARFLYARGRTSAVIRIQGASAALAVILAGVAVWWNGLLGAAMAVPLYFGAQLTLTTIAALRLAREER